MKMRGKPYQHVAKHLTASVCLYMPFAHAAVFHVPCLYLTTFTVVSSSQNTVFMLPDVELKKKKKEQHRENSSGCVARLFHVPS